jgi:predicted DNA repair protein MutK
VNLGGTAMLIIAPCMMQGHFLFLLILGGIIMEEIKEMKEKTRAIAHFMEKEQNKTNKELLIAAAICTFIGILIGFFIGKTTTSKNTIKKYNECFSYDFGDDEEEKDEE